MEENKDIAGAREMVLRDRDLKTKEKDLGFLNRGVLRKGFYGMKKV